MRLAQIVEKIAVHTILIIAVILAMIPMLWIIVAAFQPNERLFQYPPNWLPSLYLDNFTSVLTRTRLPQWLINSSVVAVSTALATALAGAMAAYAFARFQFRGRNALLYARAGDPDDPRAHQHYPTVHHDPVGQCDRQSGVADHHLHGRGTAAGDLDVDKFFPGNPPRVGRGSAHGRLYPDGGFLACGDATYAAGAGRRGNSCLRDRLERVCHSPDVYLDERPKDLSTRPLRFFDHRRTNLSCAMAICMRRRPSAWCRPS